MLSHCRNLFLLIYFVLQGPADIDMILIIVLSYCRFKITKCFNESSGINSFESMRIKAELTPNKDHR